METDDSPAPDPDDAFLQEAEIDDAISPQWIDTRRREALELHRQVAFCSSSEDFAGLESGDVTGALLTWLALDQSALA